MDQLQTEFWLGDRGSGGVTGFDARVRSARLIETLHLKAAAGSPDRRRFLRLHITPALPTSGGSQVDEIVVSERNANTDIGHLRKDAGSVFGLGWLSVYVYRIADHSRISNGEVEQGAFTLEYPWAEISLRRAQLPPTQENYFDDYFRSLELYVAREGHSNVPKTYVDGDMQLGVWVANIKFEQANLGIRRDWAERLEQIPGWRWLPGDDFELLERFARRERHTHPAIDYEEDWQTAGEVGRGRA